MTAAKSLVLALVLTGCTLAPPPPAVHDNPDVGVGVDAPSSPLRVTVFSDYGCARCGELNLLLTALVPEYQGRVVLSFRDYITPAINPGAYAAAVGARCAAEQGKGERFARSAFRYQGAWEDLPPDQLTTWAAEAQAEVPRFRQCVDEKRPAALIAADVADAKLLRVSKTPAIFLGSARIDDPGTKEAWKALLDASVNAITRRDGFVTPPSSSRP